jgi:hypothetical protein
MAAQAVLALARLRALWQGSARLVGACWPILVSGACCRSSVVEHSIGNGEVDSSILSGSTSRFPSKPFKININPDSLLAADCISAVSAETNHEYLCQLVYKTGTTVHILSTRPNGAACVRFASRDQPEVCCPPASSRLMDGFRTNRAGGRHGPEPAAFRQTDQGAHCPPSTLCAWPGKAPEAIQGWTTAIVVRVTLRLHVKNIGVCAMQPFAPVGYECLST